jgi:hypothetical protein
MADGRRQVKKNLRFQTECDTMNRIEKSRQLIFHVVLSVKTKSAWKR